MTDRCEPPPELRDLDGWHWVEAPAIKHRFVRRWWRARGEWCWADMDERTLRSFRYLSPVATPAEVEALQYEIHDLRHDLNDAKDVERENATLRARVAELEGALDKIAECDVPAAHSDPPGNRVMRAAMQMMNIARAALSPATEG